MSDTNIDSDANYRSHANYLSHANYGSHANYRSDANYGSYANYRSDANYFSDANYRSDANYFSHANYRSHANYEGKGLYKCAFTYQLKGAALVLFKTKVSENYFDKTIAEFWSKCDGWKPRHTDIFDFYIKAGNDWAKVKPQDQSEKKSYQAAWVDIPKAALEYISSIPEFDAEIFKEITGIDVTKENDWVEIVCEGKTVRISRESARALNLID